MAHYNLYDSLSLDPTADSSQLVADIDAKLAQLSPENAAAHDELTTAREIFSVKTAGRSTTRKSPTPPAQK